MQCPVDAKPLKSIFSDEIGVEIDICDACHGVWFDSEELAIAASQYRIQPPSDEEKDLFVLPPGDTHMWHKPEEYCCPQDGSLMETYAYAGDSGVYIDRCTQCSGFWLDDGELKRIKKYLAPNGLADGLAEAVVAEMQDFERIKRGFAEGAVMISHIRVSALFLRDLVQLVERYLIDRANREENGEKPDSERFTHLK